MMGCSCSSLGVEHAQGICFDAALRVGTEFVLYFFEFGFEQRDVAAAAAVGSVADGIDFELNAGKLSICRRRSSHLDEFGVSDGVFGEFFGGVARGIRFNVFQDFGADLVELAVAALLRAFAAEHRADVVELLRLRKLLHVVFDVSAADGSGCFGTQTRDLNRDALNEFL